MAKAKQVISASRRTDIPAWYTPWFLASIRNQRAEVTNPYNREVRRVDLSPDRVHSIVFWSKNYGPFLDLDAHGRLTDLGYKLFFNFTVNAESPLLEPGIPPLDQRLAQVDRLSTFFTPGQVAWRFDPVCFYELENESANNLKGFESIARYMADCGVTRCITSFYDPYKKVDTRIRALARSGGPNFRFTEPGRELKIRIIQKMAALLDSLKMGLGLCCEAPLLKTSENLKNIGPGACISGKELKQLFGGSPTMARDQGQRKAKGCTCTQSIDIGSYDHHPCPHNCLFCYARTAQDTQ